MFIGGSVMTMLSFRFALTFALVESSIFLLMEGDCVWIAVGAIAATNI
jgi:hypothetical protein